MSSNGILSLAIGALLWEKLMSGKLLIVWRHSLCSDITKVRYMTPEISRTVHSEIVNLFFPPDSEESDEISSAQNSRKSSEYLLFVLTM